VCSLPKAAANSPAYRLRTAGIPLGEGGQRCDRRNAGHGGVAGRRGESIQPADYLDYDATQPIHWPRKTLG